MENTGALLRTPPIPPGRGSVSRGMGAGAEKRDTHVACTVAARGSPHGNAQCPPFGVRRVMSVLCRVSRRARVMLRFALLLFRTRPTLVGEDRPSSASRASSGASLSSDGASPVLPPAPASQPARGRHRRPHALTLVVGAVFLRGPRRYTGRWAMAGLVAGHTGPSGGQYVKT